jgi:hypothetical protein
MISIIISSYKPAYFEAISRNIDETIGAPYEIIQVENPGRYGMCEAYNIGASKSQYDILCFMHEDIKMLTQNWGINILKHFQHNAKLGLVGVAGGIYKTALPTGWFHYRNDYIKVNMVQHEKDGSKTVRSTYSSKLLDKVKTLDGMFLVTRKAIWSDFKFNDELKGFHLYDIDFSLRVSQKYDVAVCYDVNLEHFSKGTYTNDWLTYTISYHETHPYLFDHDEGDNHLIRTCWYHFLLQDNQFSLSNRFKYIQALGLDKKSIPFALTFLFPGILKPIFYFFVKLAGKDKPQRV